jgi:hypothetical protein
MLRSTNAPLAAVALAAALAAGCEPAPAQNPLAAVDPANCDRLDDPDERAVCDSRRADIYSLTQLATSEPDTGKRTQALAALGREPCFVLPDACAELAPRLEHEQDAAARRLVGPALTCRCGPAAFDLLAEALRTAAEPDERLALIQAAADAVTSGRTGEPTGDELLALANVLVARMEDEDETAEVRRAAAGAIPLLGVDHATDRLIDRTADSDAEVRLQAEIAAGDSAALVPGLLDRFRSSEPAERVAAIQGLAFLAAESGTAQAAILEAALLGGEDPSPDVRDAAVRLDPTVFLEGERDVLAAVVAAHLVRGEAISDAPAELAALRIDELLPNRVRRQVLAAAALLAVAVAGPAGDLGAMPEDESDPFLPQQRMLGADDPEMRLVALIAVRRGLEQAATVRRPADPNPVVDAIERGQGDRLRVVLSLANVPIEPGRWEPLLPPAAAEALENPLDRALLQTFDRLSRWRIPGGDQTSERARLAALYSRMFLRGFDDEERALADARSLEAASRVADLALQAESEAESVVPCLDRAGTPWSAGFPRALEEFRALNAQAAGTACQDDELILTTEDLGDACEKAQGEAAVAVGSRCE